MGNDRWRKPATAFKPVYTSEAHPTYYLFGLSRRVFRALVWGTPVLPCARPRATGGRALRIDKSQCKQLATAFAGRGQRPAERE